MEDKHYYHNNLFDIFLNFINNIVIQPLDKIIKMLNLTARILIYLLLIIIIVILCLTFIILGICYFSFIIIKKNYSRYEELIYILKSIECNNNSNFMNYGYWSKKNMSLRKANKKLCKKLFKKGELDKAETILDVGCGYGEQDFYWKKKTDAKIHAIDINKISIKKANQINNNNDIIFEKGDACKLKFKNESFDRVVNLESGFHYNPRLQFLKESYRVLKKGGKLVVADILYSDDTIDIFNILNRFAFSKLFNIPDSNKISINEFKKQLELLGFEVVITDITDKT